MAYKIALYNENLGIINGNEDAKDNAFKFMVIDNVDGNSLSYYSPEEFKKKELSKYKNVETEIAAYWSKIGGIKFDDEELYNQQIEDLKTIAKNCNYLKIKNIIINGLIVNGDPLYYQDIILEKMRGYSRCVEKTGVTLLIYVDKNTFNKDAGKLLEICKVANNIKVLFDSSRHLEAGEVPMAAYRHLRNNIGMFMAKDIDKENMPTVVGLGEAKIMDILRMGLKDKFDGYVILSPELKQLDMRSNIYGKLKVPVVNFFVMASKKYRSLRSIDKILNKTRSDEVTTEDIVKVQILALNKIIARAERTVK